MKIFHQATTTTSAPPAQSKLCSSLQCWRKWKNLVKIGWEAAHRSRMHKSAWKPARNQWKASAVYNTIEIHIIESSKSMKSHNISLKAAPQSASIQKAAWNEIPSASKKAAIKEIEMAEGSAWEKIEACIEENVKKSASISDRLCLVENVTVTYLKILSAPRNRGRHTAASIDNQWSDHAINVVDNVVSNLQCLHQCLISISRHTTLHRRREMAKK